MKKLLTDEQKKFIIENYSTKVINYCFNNLNVNKNTISSFAIVI
jgi:hypothetical protein